MQKDGDLTRCHGRLLCGGSVMKVNAYGRELVILRENDSWRVIEAGNEGKSRLVKDIHLPDTTRSAEIVQYLSDLLHEYASDRHPGVFEHE